MAQQEYAITGDLIELSDLFRRTAQFGAHQNNAKELVKLTHDFGCACTWFYGEYDMSHGLNQRALEWVDKALRGMAAEAQKAGIEEITLPLHAKHPDAKNIRKHLIGKQDYPVAFTFKTQDYAKDLDNVGVIDTRIKTVLDEGVRGIAAIDSNIKYKWDADIAKGRQLDLKL